MSAARSSSRQTAEYAGPRPRPPDLDPPRESAPNQRAERTRTEPDVTGTPVAPSPCRRSARMRRPPAWPARPGPASRRARPTSARSVPRPNPTSPARQLRGSRADGRPGRAGLRPGPQGLDASPRERAQPARGACPDRTRSHRHASRAVVVPTVGPIAPANELAPRSDHALRRARLIDPADRAGPNPNRPDQRASATFDPRTEHRPWSSAVRPRSQMNAPTTECRAWRTERADRAGTERRVARTSVARSTDRPSTCDVEARAVRTGLVSAWPHDGFGSARRGRPQRDTGSKPERPDTTMRSAVSASY